MAIAYKTPDQGWVTKGWWTFRPAQCRVLRILHEDWYYHFESSSFNDGHGGTSFLVWPEATATPQLFVGRQDSFAFAHADHEQGYCALRTFHHVTHFENLHGYVRVRLTVAQNHPVVQAFDSYNLMWTPPPEAPGP